MAAHQRREAWSENCEKPLPSARELAAGWGWLRVCGRLPHSHLHEKKNTPLASPAKAIMVNHNFYSTAAATFSRSPVDSPPFPPLSTE